MPLLIWSSHEFLYIYWHKNWSTTMPLLIWTDVQSAPGDLLRLPAFSLNKKHVHLSFNVFIFISTCKRLCY